MIARKFKLQTPEHVEPTCDLHFLISKMFLGKWNKQNLYLKLTEKLVQIIIA